MKNAKLNLRSLMMLMVLGLFIVGCSNDESTDTNDAQNYNEVSKSSEIDRATEAMDDISLRVYEAQEYSDQNRSTENFNFLPNCVTVTVVMQQMYREVTIDFGTEGCLVNGDVYMGKIILTYTRNPQAQEIYITKTLEDFYFNTKNIVGGKTILKQLSNDNGNPQFTKTTDITIIWPDGSEASRQGVRIREWIEGFGSGVWSDNVFETTGHWSTTFINGNMHNYVVMEPLRREAVCYFFVSGTIDVERTNFSGVFDYGDGSCDNMATFTFDNGDSVDIVLN